MRHSILVRFAPAVLLLALLASGGAFAVESKEILQAVKSGVPNTGNNRVVMAEITAGDW
jgi:hypothetical protein